MSALSLTFIIAIGYGQPMTKVSALLIPLFFACGSMVQARVGESINECEARYGKVIERRSATISTSDPDACVFSKAGITIVAEFKNGKAWRIVYRMAHMDEEAVRTFLDVESSGSEWSAPLKLAGQEVRSSADHQRIAILIPGKRIEDPSTFVFASSDCAKASRKDYQAKLATVAEIVKGRIQAKPMKGL